MDTAEGGGVQFHRAAKRLSHQTQGPEKMRSPALACHTYDISSGVTHTWLPHSIYAASPPSLARSRSMTLLGDFPTVSLDGWPGTTCVQLFLGLFGCDTGMSDTRRTARVRRFAGRRRSSQGRPLSKTPLAPHNVSHWCSGATDDSERACAAHGRDRTNIQTGNEAKSLPSMVSFGRSLGSFCLLSSALLWRATPA
jgi:hypothetical protein